MQTEFGNYEWGHEEVGGNTLSLGNKEADQELADMMTERREALKKRSNHRTQTEEQQGEELEKCR